MRPNDIAAIKQYRQDNECSLFEAKRWDDDRRVTQAIESATTLDEIRPVLLFLKDQLFYNHRS